MAENEKIKPELFVVDSNQKYVYAGLCKIVINATKSRQLIIEPVDETFKTFSASFDWKFFQKKNMLFIFGPHETQSCVLILKNEQSSLKIINVIQRNKKDNAENENYKEQEIFEERFILPVIEQTRVQGDIKLKEFLVRVINLFDENEEQKYFSPLNEEEILQIKPEFINEFEEEGEIKNEKHKNKSAIRINTEAPDEGEENNNPNTLHSDYNDVNEEVQNSDEDMHIDKEFIFESTGEYVTKSRSHNFRKRRFVESNNNSDDEDSEYGSNNSCDALITDESENEKTPKKKKIKKSKTSPPKGSKSMFNWTNSKIINSSKFKLIECKVHGKVMKHIIIFIDDEKTFCYDYIYYADRDCYYCRECTKKNYYHHAKLEQDRNGITHVRIHSKNHICEKLEYNPDEYLDPPIIEKPNYEFQKYFIKKEIIDKLIIFIPETNPKLCYEFNRNKSINSYKCAACILLDFFYYANIINLNTDEEYIELSKKQHICKPIIFDPEKYYYENQVIKLPNFELKDKTWYHFKTLIVFDSSMKFCYNYDLESKNRYVCQNCQNQNKTVFAKLNYDKENIPFVMLGHEKHICKLQPYIPETKEAIIIESKHFKLVPEAKRKPKLIIFSPENHLEGYVFALRANNVYACMKCYRFTANLCQRENGENFISLREELKHECKFKKFEQNQEKLCEEVSIFAPDFIVYCSKKEPNKPRVAIYAEDNRSLCYEYYNYPAQKAFECRSCMVNHKIYVSAKALKDSNGNEYFRLGRKHSHLCKPQKVSKVITSEMKILKCTGVAIPDQRPTEENRMIKECDFELCRNKSGVADAEMILFHSKDRSLCYRFIFFACRKKYYCSPCISKHKTNVTAELKDSENGEKFIFLGKDQIHKCQPFKYADIQEMRSYNFSKLHPPITKRETLLIFTSNDRKQYYKYEYYNHHKCFYCSKCMEQNKFLSGKIEKDKNGKEYIKFGSQKHCCSPEEYNSEKFKETPKIKTSEFEIFPNTKGVPNSRIIIFNGKENEKFVYEYSMNNQKYICIDCKSKGNNRVNLKIRDSENGENFLELSNSNHICSKRNLIQKDRMFIGFKIEETNSNGNHKITTTDSNRKIATWKFAYDSELKLYYCLGCEKNERFITYKIRKNAENKEYLVLNDKHTCMPKN